MKDQIIRAFSLGETIEDISMEFDIPVNEIEVIVREYKDRNGF